MRLRNVKNKEEILYHSDHLILDGSKYKGKWNDIFGNDHPIYIEIGMGKGKFLVENALLYPEINFIGIERYDSVLARALPKIPDTCKNIRILRLNAIEIDTIFDHEIDRIYLNFSDPWPKKRHRNRRLMSKLFLTKYDIVFKDTKEIHMKTDNQHLFEFALEELSQYHYQFDFVSLNLHDMTKEDNITTEYEEKFISFGKPIYKCIASKKN